MAITTIQIVSAIAGFGPAIVLLYYTLRNYTFPKVQKPFFDDRKVFAFLALGIVLGMILFAFEAWSGTAASAETLLALYVGLAVMEELMKLVILNFPRFQRKLDTAFYGLSMGLGIAATLGFARVYSTALDLSEDQTSELAALAVSGILLGVQTSLLHGSTTTLIGIGVVRRDIKGYFSEALLIHLGYSLLMIPSALIEDLMDPLSIAGIAGATAVVVYGYWKVYHLSLPVLVRDAKRISKSWGAPTQSGRT